MQLELCWVLLPSSGSTGRCWWTHKWSHLSCCVAFMVRVHQRNGFINTWTLPFHAAVTHWPTNTCRSCMDKQDSCSGGSLSLSVASLSCFFCSFSFSSITDAIFSSLVWMQRKSAEDHCRATPLPPVAITVGCEELIPSVAVCGMQRSLIFARDKTAMFEKCLVNYAIFMTWVNELFIYSSIFDYLPVYNWCLNLKGKRNKIRFCVNIIPAYVLMIQYKILYLQKNKIKQDKLTPQTCLPLF